VRPSAGFLLRFFGLAAALFALWSFGGLGDFYGRTVIAVAEPFARAMTGFSFARVVPSEHGLDVIIRRGDTEATLPMQPREMFSGLIPFLALIGATAGLPPLRRLRAAAIGVAAMFAFHLGLMILGPYMTGIPQAQLGVVWMRRINTMIDIFYGFYGLVGYAALPFLLWWALTQRGRNLSTTPDAKPRDRKAAARSR
jgi:hypothetical protein